MPRNAAIAIAASALVAVAILVGGLVPTSLGQGPVRRDGPVLHALAFGLLVLPLVMTWPRRWLAVISAATVFGAGIEGLQFFTDRAPEAGDLVANLVGASVGAAAGLILARLRGGLRRRFRS
jgi:VanZ family protein